MKHTADNSLWPFWDGENVTLSKVVGDLQIVIKKKSLWITWHAQRLESTHNNFEHFWQTKSFEKWHLWRLKSFCCREPFSNPDESKMTSMKHTLSHTHTQMHTVILTKKCPRNQHNLLANCWKTHFSALTKKQRVLVPAAAGNFAKVDPRVDELCKYLMTLSCGSYADNATCCWWHEHPSVQLGVEGLREVGWFEV